jgi:hypothetical protein
LGGKKAWRGKSNISPGPAEKKKKVKGRKWKRKKKNNDPAGVAEAVV